MKIVTFPGVRIMESLIGEWIGKIVKVTLRLGGGYNTSPEGKLEGMLLQVSEAGLMIELPKNGQTFVPVSAMLYISLASGQ
jgi:hypothetical protein